MIRCLLLLFAMICMTACAQQQDYEQAHRRVPGLQPGWQQQRHPGPYTSVTPPGGTAERCVSCHEFSESSTISSFLPGQSDRQSQTLQETVPDPLHPSGTHPGGWLAWHDVHVSGCVGCHGGNASGTSYDSAGHEFMFDNRTTVDGMPVEVAREAACGRCHEGILLPAAPLLSRGRALMQELSCRACHDLPEWFSAPPAGPDLGRIGEKYGAQLLALLPNHVHQFKPDSRMPQFDLPAREAADIATFLAAGHAPLTSGNELPQISADDEQVLALLAKARCVNCHVLPGLPQGLTTDSLPPPVARLWQIPQGSIGPSLQRVGRRLSADWIADFLSDTHAWNPLTRMPRYELSVDDAQLLAGWLYAATKQAGPELPELPDLSGAYAVEGNSLFMSRGCSACHQLNGRTLETARVGPSLMGVGDRIADQWQIKAPEIDNLYDYLLGNMANPTSVGNPRMPLFALDDDQRLAIVTALLAEPADTSHRVAPLRDTRKLDVEALKRDWRTYWSYPVPPQGGGDPALSLYEREIHPESCRICHREQYTDWQGTRHSRAMGPGIVGQIVDMDAAGYDACLKCHAVLSEQQHVRRVAGVWQDNPDYREDLYLTGVSCASCHLRAHTRFSAVKGFQQYPWSRDDLRAHPLERTELLQSSDFCWNCHQFDESRSIADGHPPLQNTNVEHREWQQATGDTRTCQDCHLPQGRHTFEGIHSPDYVRKSLDISAQLLDKALPTARLTIYTRDLGHYFPTYVTPAVFAEAMLLDAEGRELAGSLQQQVIRRDARTRRAAGGGSEWYDELDSRIPPGVSRDLDFPLEPARYPGAVSVRLVLRVEPDYFYHNAYERWIEDDARSTAGRSMLDQAWAETSRDGSGYQLFEEILPLQ